MDAVKQDFVQTKIMQISSPILINTRLYSKRTYK